METINLNGKDYPNYADKSKNYDLLCYYIIIYYFLSRETKIKALTCAFVRAQKFSEGWPMPENFQGQDVCIWSRRVFARSWNSPRLVKGWQIGFRPYTGLFTRIRTCSREYIRMQNKFGGFLLEKNSRFSLPLRRDKGHLRIYAVQRYIL